MITNADTRKLKATFATKKELRRTENKLVIVIEAIANTIITEIRSEMGSLVGSLRDEMRELRKEMKDLRIEFRDSRTETAGVLENHKRRITRLEEKDFN